MSVKFKVRGVDQMVRLIANKGKKARIATNRELDLSSKRIERMAKVKAPVDTGALKNSIFSTKAGNLTYKVTAPQHYAIYVEKGTRKMRAQPYLKPALDAERPKLISNLRKLYER
ncbi:HK97-gp10 family putative phage morphogenesis protein [Streptococcus infantarius]|uniref:HK97-gp10 family putative phage morphogenesis protein n=1 Tax=Streptococcus infantarius TaxID=102684 RepID=UPI00208E7A16|nr:HK97-gp10 family putative phage morphogenesis protein [Streptococcus infantarius]MCO4568521.1 phage protein, HK97 gp10 family [Streptococcus infantarius subsp. infantarius]MCO4657610.1 phage protein, HK97 gp10 family [Streptococcus infantarius subsp. infantarius]